eukprot:967579-Pyramimonas_sp.AAC.1
MVAPRLMHQPLDLLGVLELHVAEDGRLRPSLALELVELRPADSVVVEDIAAGRDVGREGVSPSEDPVPLR